MSGVMSTLPVDTANPAATAEFTPTAAASVPSEAPVTNPRREITVPPFGFSTARTLSVDTAVYLVRNLTDTLAPETGATEDPSLVRVPFLVRVFGSTVAGIVGEGSVWRSGARIAIAPSAYFRPRIYFG